MMIKGISSTKQHKSTRENGAYFKTIQKYIELVLSEILREEEPEQVHTPEKIEEIKKRHRRLRYIE